MEVPMSDIDYSKCYRTTDLYFAAFLKVADVPFVDCVPKAGERNRKEFLFEYTDAVKELKNVWFRREQVKISPLAFSQEIQMLKGMTHM